MLPGRAFLPAPEIYDLFRELTTTRTELDQKVEEALMSIRTASSVVAELEELLQERAKTLQAVQAEVERLSELAAVEESKAKPILKELDTLARKGRPRERLIAFAINIAAGVIIFFGGVFLGPYFTHEDSSRTPTPTESAHALVSGKLEVARSLDLLQTHGLWASAEMEEWAPSPNPLPPLGPR